LKSFYVAISIFLYINVIIFLCINQEEGKNKKEKLISFS